MAGCSSRVGPTARSRRQERRDVEARHGVNGPADIGVDTKRSVVAIPLFNDGKVAYYKLP